MTLTHHPDLIVLLVGLIEHDQQALLAYDEAIARLEDPTASSRLRELRAEHERHVRELSECVVELGGEPPRFLRDGPCPLAIDEQAGTRAILIAMRVCEQNTHDAYRRALALARPVASARLRQVLQRGFEDECRHGSWLATQVA